jgi:uncharacterized membrane protein
MKKFGVAFFHSLKILAASLLPLFAVLLTVWVNEQRVMSLKEITGKGEIIIICIPIAVAIIFSLYDNKLAKKSITFPSIVFYVTIIFSCLSIYLYADDFNETVEASDNRMLYSIYFFCWVFIAMIVDKYNLIDSESVSEKRSDDMDELLRKFNKING